MNRRSSPLFESKPSTVFRNLTSWEGLVRRLDDLRISGNEFIHVAAVGSREDLSEWFRSKNRPIGIVPLDSTQDMNLFAYERRVESSGTMPIGLFYDLNHSERSSRLPTAATWMNSLPLIRRSSRRRTRPSQEVRFRKTVDGLLSKSGDERRFMPKS